MTKWEYCRIWWMTREATEAGKDEATAVLKEYEFSAQRNRPNVLWIEGGSCEILGSSAEPESIKKLGEKMAELGLDGWELVSHTETTAPSAFQEFFFKRPIEE